MGNIGKYSRCLKHIEPMEMDRLTNEAIKAREHGLTYGQLKVKEMTEAKNRVHIIPTGYSKAGRERK